LKIGADEKFSRRQFIWRAKGQDENDDSFANFKRKKKKNCLECNGLKITCQIYHE